MFDEFSLVGKVLTRGEVDQRIESLCSALELAKTTDKRIAGGEIFFADYIEPLVRMGQVISGKPADTSLIASSHNNDSPCSPPAGAFGLGRHHPSSQQ